MMNNPKTKPPVEKKPSKRNVSSGKIGTKNAMRGSLRAGRRRVGRFVRTRGISALRSYVSVLSGNGTRPYGPSD